MLAKQRFEIIFCGALLLTSIPTLVFSVGRVDRDQAKAPHVAQAPLSGPIAAAPVPAIPPVVTGPVRAASPANIHVASLASEVAPRPATPSLPEAEARQDDDSFDDLVTGSIRRHKQVSILQLGDSHTAADFFTGEVRRVMQARYGNGSAGYLEVGRPHPGVLNTNLHVEASSGWTYSGIQRASADVDAFALSGFRASTAKAGETVTFTSQADLPYTDIDVEVEKGEGRGAIDLLVDGRLASDATVDTSDPTHDVVHVQTKSGTASLRQLAIRTRDSTPTSVLSVGIFNKRSGLTYSNIGFPGATVDILNKFPEATVIAALKHLSPDVVVLAFGTNEGFNDKLDLDQYRMRYAKVLRTIQAGAPKARIVMIGPSDANRVPPAQRAPACKKNHDDNSCKAPETPDKPLASSFDANKAAAEVKVATAGPVDERQSEPKLPGEIVDAGRRCLYSTPPQLDRVRALQRDLAAKRGIAFWDWSSLMPKHCGAQAWVSASPPLMTADHVHFTKDGYRRCGRAFAAFLDPIVRSVVRAPHVVSNH